MTRKDYRLIAATLRADRAAPDGFYYLDAPAWERGAFDQWSTTVLAIARALSDASGYDRNGNRRFDTERFLSAAGFSGGVR